VEKVAQKELNRLKSIPTASSEYTVARTYLDWIADLPWAKRTDDNLDIENAKGILDTDHYGLDKIKKRILEYLAVRKLKNDMRGPILCFVGPPGVARPRWASPSPAPPAASSCGSAWAACATRRRSAATGAPTWAPCPAGSSSP